MNPFEKMGKSYAEKSSTSIYNSMYERPAILSLLPNLQDTDVLDAGCGSGTLTGHLLSKGAKVTGIDITQSLLDIAKEKYDDVEFIRGDLSKPLDFNTNQFDLIVSSLTLHYIEDWNAMFAELSRILKPGGNIVFSTHHPNASRRWFDLRDYFQRKLCSDVWTVEGEKVIVQNYHRSLTEMVNAFSQNGLVIERILEPQPIPEAKEIDPMDYHYLNTREHFICFRLSKQ